MEVFALAILLLSLIYLGKKDEANKFANRQCSRAKDLIKRIYAEQENNQTTSNKVYFPSSQKNDNCNFNYESFKTSYFQKIKEYKKEKKWILFRLKFFCYTTLIGQFISLLAYLSMDANKLGMEPWVKFLACIISLIVIVIEFDILKILDKKGMDVSHIHESDSLSSNPKFQYFLQKAYEIKNNLGLDHYSIEFFSDHSHTYSPSVLENSSKIFVLLPLPFINIFLKEKEIFNSCLSHELGHVLQQDSMMLNKIDIIYKKYHWFFIFIIIIFILNFIDILFFSDRLAVSLVAPLLFIVTFFLMQRVRNKSEILADHCVPLVSNHFMFFEYIKTFSVKRSYFDIHPPPDFRENSLNEEIKKH